MRERGTPARRFRHHRAFWAMRFVLANILTFRGALAAESAGGSVSRHASISGIGNLDEPMQFCDSRRN
jgi:hypothetical protein